MTVTLAEEYRPNGIDLNVIDFEFGSIAGGRGYLGFLTLNDSGSLSVTFESIGGKSVRVFGSTDWNPQDNSIGEFVLRGPGYVLRLTIELVESPLNGRTTRETARIGRAPT